jgi:hypothetical protein
VVPPHTRQRRGRAARSKGPPHSNGGIDDPRGADALLSRHDSLSSKPGRWSSVAREARKETASARRGSSTRPVLARRPRSCKQESSSSGAGALAAGYRTKPATPGLSRRAVGSAQLAVSRAQTEVFGVAPTRRQDLGTSGPNIGDEQVRRDARVRDPYLCSRGRGRPVAFRPLGSGWGHQTVGGAAGGLVHLRAPGERSARRAR